MNTNCEVFNKAIIDCFETTLASLRQRSDMHLFPRWEEGKLLTSLRLWEVIMEDNPDANQAIRSWLKYRKQAHPNHPDWMLADTPTLRNAVSTLAAESPLDARAFERVRKGMKRVFRRVQTSYGGEEKQPNSRWMHGVRLTELLIKRQLALEPFTDDASVLEASLHSLVEWFEWFLGHGKTRNTTLSIWRDEIRRTRKYGPPSTRTFSTVSPLEKRIQLAKTMPKAELRRAYTQLIRWMRKVFSDLRDHLKDKERASLSLNGQNQSHKRAALA